MDAADRAAFLGGIKDAIRDNLRNRETRAKLTSVAACLADYFEQAAQAYAAMQLVIAYGQAVAEEAYQAMREAA